MKTELMHLPQLQGLLGSCCNCGTQDRPVQYVVIVAMKSPEPGNGCWGCMTCDLPQAGAMAVLCDVCGEAFEIFGGMPANIVLGSPDENRRLASSKLTEPFDHDDTKHVGKLTELVLGGQAPAGVADLAEMLSNELIRFLERQLNREVQAKMDRHFRN